MAGEGVEKITLDTLDQNLMAGFAGLQGEVRGGFADLKATLIAGFRGHPSRESSEERIRLLREGNRPQEERLIQFDVRTREQHLEIQQTQRAVVEALQGVADGVRALTEGQRALHQDISALIVRLDALIKGRGDGAPAS